MKKVHLIFILAFIAISPAIMAQSVSEEVDLVQAAFGMEKKAVVAEFIQLDDEAAEIFWTLYDSYETKRKELGKRRIALLSNYAEKYEAMDDATTSNMLREMMQLQIGNDKLLSAYSKKIKSKLDVKTAAQFYQIEGYILSKVRVNILENIPVIGAM